MFPCLSHQPVLVFTSILIKHSFVQLSIKADHSIRIRFVYLTNSFLVNFGDIKMATECVNKCVKANPQNNNNNNNLERNLLREYET